MTTAVYAWRLIGLPAAVLIGGYVLAVMAARIAVGPMLYYPHLASRRAPASLVTIKSGADDIAVVHLPNPQAPFTIWFFHGNAEDLGDVEPFLVELRQRGFAVVAWDYPGYGRSSGQPTEPSVYAAARAVREYVRGPLHVRDDRLLIYGRSLGTGPAVQMAIEQPAAGLILQAPFVSVYRVMTRWPLLPFDQYRSLGKIGGLKAPLLVLHGRRDEVIPCWHGEALQRAAPGPKRALWVEGAHHNDFIEVAGEAYWAALRDFSELCGRVVAPSRP